MRARRRHEMSRERSWQQNLRLEMSGLEAVCSVLGARRSCSRSPWWHPMGSPCATMH